MKRTFITKEQAISILPESDNIHSFYNAAFGLCGADWSRENIIDKINSSDNLELTGPAARGMGHGLCAYNDGAKQGDVLFIETNEEKTAALEATLEAVDDGPEPERGPDGTQEQTGSEEAKLTNAERIRAMSDDELGDFLMDVSTGLLMDKQIMNVKAWLRSPAEDRGQAGHDN